MVSILVDEHLLLRTFEDNDAPALFSAVDKDRAHLHPWLNWVDATLKPEDSLRYIQQSRTEAHEQRSLALGIFYDGKIIGGTGMHNWDRATYRAQVGYWLSKEYEGKGILHRCLQKLVDFMFSKLDLNKIEIHFSAENRRSANVAQRLGCKVEGIIRQSQLRHGKLEDVAVTGMLKSEWKALNP